MKTENEVRKSWLRAFYLRFGFIVLVAVGSFFIYDDPEFHPRSYQLGRLVGYIFAALIPAAILYHFAYEKRGTKWLMLVLIVTPIFLVRELVDAIAAGDWLVEEGAVLLIGLGINVYYWIHCLRLWQLNNSLKGDSDIERSEEAKAFLETLHKESSLESLNDKLFYGISKWPQWERQISREYERKKQALSQA